MKAISRLVGSILILTAGQSFASHVPSGSYMDSCYDIKVSTESAPYRLQARCADYYGNYKQTVLESFDNCYNDIENKNGRLTCSLKSVPNNFHLTCTDVVFSQRALFALCQDSAGQYQATALNDFLFCPSQIQNINGQLQCM